MSQMAFLQHSGEGSQFSDHGRDSQSMNWLNDIDFDMIEARGREVLKETDVNANVIGNFDDSCQGETLIFHGDQSFMHKTMGNQRRDNNDDDDDDDELLAVIEQLEGRYREEERECPPLPLLQQQYARPQRYYSPSTSPSKDISEINISPPQQQQQQQQQQNIMKKDVPSNLEQSRENSTQMVKDEKTKSTKSSIGKREKIGKLRFVKEGRQKTERKAPLDLKSTSSEQGNSNSEGIAKSKQPTKNSSNIENISPGRTRMEDIISFSPDNQQTKEKAEDISDFSESPKMEDTPLNQNQRESTSASTTPIRKTKNGGDNKMNKSPKKKLSKNSIVSTPPSALFQESETIDLPIRQALDFFGLSTFQRGNLYAEEEHAFDLNENPDHGQNMLTIRGKCWGSAIIPYDVEILVKGSAVSKSRCSCPVSKSCKHGCAVFLLWHNCKKNGKPLSTKRTLGARLFDSVADMQSIKAKLIEVENMLHVVVSKLDTISEQKLGQENAMDTNKVASMQRRVTEIERNEERCEPEPEPLENKQSLIGQKRDRKSMQEEDGDIDDDESPAKRAVTFREPLSSFASNPPSTMPSPTLTPPPSSPLCTLEDHETPSKDQNDDTTASQEDEEQPSFSMDDELKEMEMALAAARGHQRITKIDQRN